METYEQMFDQQIALGMAKAGGIGLAPFIEAQLARQESRKVDIASDAIPTSVVLERRAFELKGR
jgi:Rod binding domain-containing protein